MCKSWNEGIESAIINIICIEGENLDSTLVHPKIVRSRGEDELRYTGCRALLFIHALIKRYEKGRPDEREEMILLKRTLENDSDRI